jgi:hypothetical protein
MGGVGDGDKPPCPMGGNMTLPLLFSCDTSFSNTANLRSSSSERLPFTCSFAWKFKFGEEAVK